MLFDTARLVYKGLRSLRRPRVSADETTDIFLRVWPFDLDVFLDMTNSKYVEMMNAGRLDHVILRGWLQVALQHRAIPLVASAWYEYRRSLRLWQKVRVETALI